jgi:hypothetical protein
MHDDTEADALKRSLHIQIAWDVSFERNTDVTEHASSGDPEAGIEPRPPAEIEPLVPEKAPAKRKVPKPVKKTTPKKTIKKKR